MKQTFMHPDQLSALDAIATTGTFEAAARTLGVSTSAVSQRVRALESSLGRVLVRRGAPCTMTDDGTVVLRYARQQALLAAEMSAELDLSPQEDAGAPVPAARLSVAVNADSLETWFSGVLHRAVRWRARLELTVADEARTSELLRDGQVMCAVSSSDARVAGCSVLRLGTARYTPMASPGLLSRFPTQGPADLAELPSIRFDADDDIQDLVRSAVGLPPQNACAHVPTASAFAQAVEAGLGWGALPPGQVARHPRLVPVPGLPCVERELFWHRWSIRSSHLDTLTEAVRQSFAESGRGLA